MGVVDERSVTSIVGSEVKKASPRRNSEQRYSVDREAGARARAEAEAHAEAGEEKQNRTKK